MGPGEPAGSLGRPSGMSLPTSRLAATGAAVVLALLLGGCGGGESGAPVAEEPPPTGSSPDEPTDESTGAPGRPCPRVLPAAGERAGADEAAEELPELPPVRRAWVCRYHPAQLGDGDGEGSSSGWERQGRAAPVADADLAPLADALDGLALLDLDTSQRVCTADLGPRFMVVLADADAGDLTGVVVDDFGCHDTRLTADPHSRPAGADGPGGAADGALQGGPRVLEALGVGRGA